MIRKMSEKWTPSHTYFISLQEDFLGGDKYNVLCSDDGFCPRGCEPLDGLWFDSEDSANDYLCEGTDLDEEELDEEELEERLDNDQQEFLDENPDLDAQVKNLIAKRRRSDGVDALGAEVDSVFGDPNNSFVSYSNASGRIGTQRTMGKLDAEVQKIMKDSLADYLEDTETSSAKAVGILKNILNNRIDINDLLITDPSQVEDDSKLFTLSSRFSGDTFNYLLSLYRKRLSSLGARNTLGVGELLFSLILKGAKLSDHQSKNNKCDLVIGNRDVEVKGNWGRLDNYVSIVIPLENSDVIKIFKNTFKSDSVLEGVLKTKQFRSKFQGSKVNNLNHFTSKAGVVDIIFDLYDILLDFCVANNYPVKTMDELFAEGYGSFLDTVYKSIYTNYPIELEDKIVTEKMVTLLDAVKDHDIDNYIRVDNELRTQIYDKGSAGDAVYGQYIVICSATDNAGNSVTPSDEIQDVKAYVVDTKADNFESIWNTLAGRGGPITLRTDRLGTKIIFKK